MFINVLTQVIILFILIFVGVILAKCKILNDTAVKSMTDFVLMVVTPCVIIKSFIREFEPALLQKLLINVTATVFIHFLFIILSRLLLKSKNLSEQKVLQFGVIFSNCGFMSIPLQQAILGEEGVFLAASYVAIFNLFVWSYGVLLMSGDKKYLAPKKLILNPGVAGVLVGLVIFLLSIPIPKIIAEPISYFAALNTPIPMVIIGYHLANSSILAGVKNIRCLWGIALRLFIFPLTALAILYLFGIRGDMLVSLAISCCAPTAANTTMFATKYGGDTSLSVNMVSLSTLFSLISMPVIVTLAQYIA